MSEWREQLPDLSKVKDRGSKKWAMSMMLPEHTTLIRKLIDEDKKAPQPILDDMDYELLNEELARAIQSGSYVELKRWKDGKIYSYTGVVLQVDAVAQKIYLSYESKKTLIPIEGLFSIGTLYEM